MKNLARNKLSMALTLFPAALLSTAASAAGTGYDETAVTDAITANQAKAVIVIGAFIVAVWVLRSMGLLKRG